MNISNKDRLIFLLKESKSNQIIAEYSEVDGDFFVIFHNFTEFKNLFNGSSIHFEKLWILQDELYRIGFGGLLKSFKLFAADSNTFPTLCYLQGSIKNVGLSNNPTEFDSFSIGI
jgi:hypothetical protein